LKVTIKATKQNDAGYWNFLGSDDQWYGAGKKFGFAKGDVIDFEVEENGKFKNAKNAKKVEGAPSAPSGAPVASGGTDWAKKDQQISWQAARNSANALLATAVSAGFQDAPDTFSKLVAASNKLTQDFFNSTLNLSNGGGNEAKAKASKPSPPDDHDEGPNDEIPF
jgi:hypothetical protein